jgi:hypothetical protein
VANSSEVRKISSLFRKKSILNGNPVPELKGSNSGQRAVTRHNSGSKGEISLLTHFFTQSQNVTEELTF